MKNKKKYFGILSIVILLWLCFPAICNAGSLEFLDLGIKQITPQTSYLYITQDTVMNAPLINICGIDLSGVRQYMEDNDVVLMVYPDDMSFEIGIQPFQLSGLQGYGSAITTSDLARLSTSELEEDYRKSFGSNWNVKIYSAKVYEQYGLQWLEGYYHLSGPGMDSDILQYDFDNGTRGLSVRIVDYAGSSIDELRMAWWIFADNVTFYDDLVKPEEAAEQNPNPTLPAIPPSRTPVPEQKTIDLTADNSKDSVGEASENDRKSDTFVFAGEDGLLEDYWWLYLLILLAVSFLYTFVLLCVPFIIYRFGVLKHPISHKKAKRIVIIYMICYFVLSVGVSVLLIYNSASSGSTTEYGSASSIIPLIVWGKVAINILTKRSKSLDRATKFLDRFDKLTKKAFNGSTVLDTSDRIRMLAIFSCVASVLVEGIKREYSLAEELIDAAREQLLIRTGEKEWKIINSFVQTVNERIRDITLSQDRSDEDWLDEMFYKYAGVACDYVNLNPSDENKRRIVDAIDEVYSIVDADVERVNVTLDDAGNKGEAKEKKYSASGLFSKKKELEFYDEDSEIFEGTDITENGEEGDISYANDGQEDKDSTLSDINLDQIKKWKDLYDSGVITEEEFLKKKKDLLNLAGTTSNKLTVCPDCGRNVSTQAAICPNCGKPLRGKVKRPSKIMQGKWWIIATVVAAIGIIALIVAKPWAKGNKWIAKADKSVLFVGCYDENGEPFCMGSGFLLFDDRTVVTNYHVVEGARAIEVYTSDDDVYDVEKVRNYSEDLDLAILTLSARTRLDPLTVGNSLKVNKGDEVVAIGSPEGLQNSVSTGVLSSHTEGLLQFTAPISHGSSGGALFNSKGEVIGVTSSSLESGQSLNFAIPIEQVVYLYHND